MGNWMWQLKVCFCPPLLSFSRAHLSLLILFVRHLLNYNNAITTIELVSVSLKNFLLLFESHPLNSNNKITTATSQQHKVNSNQNIQTLIYQICCIICKWTLRDNWANNEMSLKEKQKKIKSLKLKFRYFCRLSHQATLIKTF